MEPTTASETESIRWRGARRLLADRRIWALATLLAVIVGAWAWWWAHPGVTRTRDTAISALENRDVKQLLALADSRERDELGASENAVYNLMKSALWDIGKRNARKIIDARLFASHPDQDRFDYIVTWANEYGLPIMMDHMATPHHLDHDNRLFSILSFRRVEGVWRFNVLYVIRGLYINRLGRREGQDAFRQEAEGAGVKGFLDESGRAHLFHPGS
ncbi:MAG: hypothetical protein IT208_14940 [Chthonomonadales bacterium]|nr:hypothetical protein [Chthonomonadales bacterium]